MKKLFCITGLPCSGKSYVAGLIAKQVYNGNCTTISCGDIARSLMTDESLKAQTAAADLFPLEDMMRSKIAEGIDNSPYDVVIVEGLPRFGDQAKWVLDKYWLMMPEIIEVVVGDNITLYNRAKMRGRDSDADFGARLAKAEKNLEDIRSVLAARFIPIRMLFSSGNDMSIVAQFNKLFKGK